MEVNIYSRILHVIWGLPYERCRIHGNSMQTGRRQSLVKETARRQQSKAQALK